MGTAHAITLKNTTIHGINNAMDRQNINSGFKKRQISEDDYQRLDPLHDKIETARLKLIESLQKKQTEKQLSSLPFWEVVVDSKYAGKVDFMGFLLYFHLEPRTIELRIRERLQNQYGSQP
jgi:hypothetical protein